MTLENAERVIPKALRQVLDTTRIWLPQSPGRRVDERGFVYERDNWWNEWRIDTPFHTLPELADFVRREIERLETWQPSVDRTTHSREMAEWKARYSPAVIPASMASEALSAAYTLVGLDQFIYLEAEEPRLVQRWLQALHAQTMRALQSEAHCYKISPIAWLFDDVACKGRLIFSPSYLHDHYVFAHIAEICAFYHAYGLKVIFHSDGNITPIVPDLLAAGVDALAPVDVLAGMDLAVLKEHFGNQVAFVGGVNIHTLVSGSTEDVRQETLRVLAAGAPGGGLILGSSSEELYDGIPQENIRTMWETTWECGRYPISIYPSH